MTHLTEAQASHRSARLFPMRSATLTGLWLVRLSRQRKHREISFPHTVKRQSKLPRTTTSTKRQRDARRFQKSRTCSDTQRGINFLACIRTERFRKCLLRQAKLDRLWLLLPTWLKTLQGRITKRIRNTKNSLIISKAKHRVPAAISAIILVNLVTLPMLTGGFGDGTLT